MKLTKRMLASALILALCLVLLPAGISVGALELPEKIDLTHDQIPFQVNPVYRDVLELSDLELPGFSGKRPDAQTMANGNYVSVDTAAAEFRSFIKSRAETFEIWVTSDSSDYNALANELFAKAIQHTGEPTEGDYLMWHCAALGAEVSRTYENGQYKFHYTFYLVYCTTAEQERQLNYAVNQLISDLGVRYATDYEKVCAVYDYMCQNITYDYANLEDETNLLKFSAYAALVNKTALGQGYASLFYRLMLELDVGTRVIAGIAGGAEHCWNIVEIDGLYYNVDATLDAAGEEYGFFLKSTWNFVEHYRYLDFESMDFHNEFPMAAEDYTEGVAAEMDPFIYISVCGDDAYWALMRSGLLEIVGTGEIYDYMPNYNSQVDIAPWQYWAENVTEVVIGEGITRIGSHAFHNQSGLRSVTLPSTLIEIGMSAFKGCTGLRNVLLPESVEIIEGSAFSNCRGLRNVTFAEGLLEIGDYAFRACRGLKDVVLPGSLLKIGYGAFSDCHVLTEITIPESVTDLDPFCFKGCLNLNAVYLNNQGSIKAETFADCTALEVVIISDNVKAIESDAFKNCTSLTEITIPESVVDLSGFYGCTNLESVTLPEGLTKIGANAFYGCVSLSDVNWPSSLIEIGESAFLGCESLANIELPNGLTTIQNHAFFGCDAITELHIPNTVVTIAVDAFACCSSITEIVIPDSLTEVTGFRACSSLVRVVLPEGITAIGRDAFMDCDALVDFIIPSTVTSIGYRAFMDSNELREITIPEGVTNIDLMAFADCNSLTEIFFRGNAPYIDNSAFENVTATIYYPHDNTTWGPHIQRDFGGYMTWVPYDTCEHVTEVREAADPTCTEPGYTGDAYCTICGEMVTRGTSIPALGHSYETVVTEPTCTEQGYTTHTCTVCGEETVDSYVDALGHSFGDWTVVTEPSCTGDGEQTRSCDTCGHIETQVIPAHGHSYVDGFCEHCGEEQPPYTLGDVNDDGSVNNIDAMLILQYAVGLLTDDSLILEAADVNGDGSANNIDAMLVLQYAVGLLDRFN